MARKTSGYADYIVELLAPLYVTAKSMFGGYGLYRDGIVFAIIADEELYFKVGAANKADYEQAGSEPFSYDAKGKKVAMSYWRVPAELFDDQDALCTWAEKAYKVAVTSKKASKK